MSRKYYDILVPIPKNGIYTYSSMANHKIGERVVVPIGNRQVTGIIIKECDKPNFQCKDVILCYDEEPLFSQHWINFILRLANYYGVSYGLALQGVISDKLLNIETAEDFEKKQIEKITVSLTPTQLKIVEDIEINNFSKHLIYGITGSGKTEVYLEIARKVIDSGKQVLYIVPEISLTPQLTNRIALRFGYEPLIFHSKLPSKKRETAFLSFAKEKINFLIGTRSSLFVPAKNLGLIIIDEEHEQSFKQEDAPPYHLRDMAVLYASILNIPIVMGSASPSIESIYNVKLNKYILHKINERPKNATLPKIEIVNLHEHDLVGDIISEPLYDKIHETIEKGEQVILFINRKGYSTSLYCRKCGNLIVCNNCSSGLVYYKSKNTSSCRYCDTNYKKTICNRCGSNDINEWGIGTEKVAEFLETMFPNKVIRIDLENASTIKKLSTFLKKFENNEAQILVGTQLIAKGLHFPKVTLVGILNIDNIISMPDFRSIERAFQLLIQVAGRAGRDSLNGSVYIQTYMPENPILKFIQDYDYNDFYDYELERRKNIGFPPYTKLLHLLISYTKEEECKNVAQIIASEIKKYVENISVLGPKEANIYVIKNRYRMTILLKSYNNSSINQAIAIANNTFEKIKKGSMMLKIDKDPYFIS